MPLKPGKENIGHNIEAEQNAGKPHNQAVAIALNYAREHGAKIKGPAKVEPMMEKGEDKHCASCTCGMSKSEDLKKKV